MTTLIFDEYIIVYKWDDMNGFPFLSGYSFEFDTSIVINHFGFFAAAQKSISTSSHISTFDASNLLKIHNFAFNQC